MKHAKSTLLSILAWTIIILGLSFPSLGNTATWQSGKASWYGSYHHGRKTASGEIFNMYGLSAAHRSLPLGTIVEVTNKANGRSIQVKINDRGPYHGNRVIDLSKGAASKLDMLKSGVGTVEIKVLSRPGPKTKSIKRVDPQVILANTAIKPKEDIKLTTRNVHTTDLAKDIESELIDVGEKRISDNIAELTLALEVLDEKERAAFIQPGVIKVNSKQRVMALAPFYTDYY